VADSDWLEHRAKFFILDYKGQLVTLFSGLQVRTDGRVALLQAFNIMEKPTNRMPQRSGSFVADFTELLLGSVRAISQLLALAGPIRQESLGGPVSIFLMAILVAINFVLVPPTYFSLVYLIVVVFAAWTSGRRTSIFIAAVGFILLVAREFQLAPHHSLTWPMGWNLLVQLSIYLFAAYSVSSVRNLIQNLEKRARERLSALELEVGERRQTEEQLRKTTQQLRQLAENITDAFWMRNVGDTRMVYVSPAYETIWGRSCKDLYPSPSGWLEAVHPEDRERVARALVKQSAGEHSEEYRIVRPDGSLRWIRDRAFPIRDHAGAVIRVVGIAEDITDRRRLECEILEISDREQARLGQDLHDSLCQKLVSAAFDNNALKRRLAQRDLPEEALVQQVATVLDDAITEARTLARGLFPVQLELDGLHVALQQLAANIHARFQIECRAHCDESVVAANNAFATHLYRIAQEAVSNAVKHARATKILIRLDVAGGFIELKITDDGVGIPLPLKTTTGMGMHTMEYRARTIGGTLNISNGPAGGTIVCCRVPQRAIGN
jgi:PAS domain S-box-containing protein